MYEEMINPNDYIQFMDVFGASYFNEDSNSIQASNPSIELKKFIIASNLELKENSNQKMSKENQNDRSIPTKSSKSFEPRNFDQ